MQFFFVADYLQNYRFFSSEPLHEIQVEFSRWKKVWAEAKQKLLLLPPRILRQEQAFHSITKLQEQNISIHYAEHLSEKTVRRRFFFHLQKQKTKHILLLSGEVILLPVSGLMALLPGPNVFFGVLALIIYTHWQAFKGIRRLSKMEYLFLPSRPLSEWNDVVNVQRQSEYHEVLERIEAAHHITNLTKILYK